MKINEVYKNKSSRLPVKKDDITRLCLVRAFDETLVTFSIAESKTAVKDVIRFSGNTSTMPKAAFLAECEREESIIPNFLYEAEEDDTE